MCTLAEHFDVVVLGGGPGGYAAALYGASAGLRVAMVEEQRVGGTCLHRGCIPPKELLQTAERSIVGYQQRQSDFDLTRIGCYELASGYARLDADVVSLAVWRSRVEGTLSPRQEAAYQEVMRRAAMADRLFDRTGCPRP